MIPQQHIKWRPLFTIDLRSLAVLRIGLGLLLLCDLGVRWPDLAAHYSDEGLLPRAAMQSYFDSRPGLLSLHMLFGTVPAVSALFAIAATIAAAFALGYRTRLTGFLSLVLLCSLQARNPFVLSGGDSLLRMLLFWMLFLPGGARFSIDAWRADLSGAVSTTGNRHFSIGAAGLVLQVAFVYWFSALLKDHPAWRSEGSAIYLALSIDQFAKPLGHAMLAWPGLLKVLTLATFWLEVIGPLAAFLSAWQGRFRLAVIAVFLGFHLVALNLTMELGIFPWVCAVGWLAFLPTYFWDHFLPVVLRRAKRLSPVLCGGTIHQPRITNAVSLQGSRRPANALAAVALLFVVAWNVRTTDFDRHEKWFPRSINPIAELFRVEQYWSMFAPYPMHDDGWIVVRGALADGSDVDLYTGKPLCWDKPADVAHTYPNQRWRKYCMNLREEKYRNYRGAFVRYLIRQHEQTAALGDTAPEPLLGVELIYMQENTLVEHLAEAVPQPVILFQSSRPGATMETQIAADTSRADVAAPSLR